MDNPHRLLFLDPGHFHAALTLRVPHPRVADDIVVYAPDGPERRDFLALVDRFNGRGTAWRVEVVTTDDPLGRIIDERRGDVVVLAGRNGGKARTMRRLHDAGFHVLADKPWLVEPGDLAEIRASLAGPPVAMEIMTGRHDLGGRLLKRIVESPEVFGAFRADGLAIESDSVHHLEKLVDGAPLRRPWWYFDVRVQGSGIVDIPTHLVDQSQWLTERAAPNAVPALLSARLSSTRVPLDAFRRVTGEARVPGALEPVVKDGALDLQCNGELTYQLGDVVARGTIRWDVAPPPGGGDTSRLIVRGTRADVMREQRRVFVTLHEPNTRALADLVASWQKEFPGVWLEGDGARDEVVVPAALDAGHEAHFALVLDMFLRAVDDKSARTDAAARTLAKYTLLQEALRWTSLSP
jgi:predicted dehydrogenase